MSHAVTALRCPHLGDALPYVANALYCIASASHESSIIVITHDTTRRGASSGNANDSQNSNIANAALSLIVSPS